ncbi:hypothetical protein [Gaiella sp.]|uniref:hypothetical protein n=1 Tax=Gaiella sp. TaxID=2663207 RepID=UPI002E33BE61|nr:hypothetical protein [Gaiella sp.]HEX5585415.1 hypothetical protein [Gaiella sp.]
MNQRPAALISPAAAADRAGLPVWAVHMLLKRRVLRAVTVRGHPRINAHELDQLLESNRPETAR